MGPEVPPAGAPGTIGGIEMSPTTKLQIHQLVTRHLAEIEEAIDEACAAQLGADLILPLRGARTMYRKWLATTPEVPDNARLNDRERIRRR